MVRKNRIFGIGCRIAPFLAALCLFSGLSFAQDSDLSQSGLSPAQIADAQISIIETSISEGQDLLTKAREQSDVSQIDCINTQLVIARGFYNVAQNASINLKEAVSRNDAEAEAHHQKLLALASEKTRSAVDRMKQCSTGVLSVAGETKSTTVRACKIEPCLSGETVYAPEQIEAQSATGADKIDAGSSVDASPYM